MHPYARWLSAGLLISLSFGCSARGGGGGFIDPDASTSGDDATAAMDSALPTGDDGTPPVDRGLPGVDLGLPGTDLGLPPSDQGVPPTDQGTPVRCGDGLCNGGETCMTCATDCGACPPSCGDGVCGSAETCTSCPPDCGACPPRCGDGTCQSPETCTSCSADCGECAPRCGDGACNGSETCSSCSGDCGPCPPSCGSLTNCTSCVADSRCGWCPTDGACQPGNASGPTGTSLCSIFGGWTRTASACTTPMDSGVVDTGVVDTGPVNITAACATAEQGTDSECGWRLETTYSCTVGTSVTIGCTGTTAADAATCATRLGSCGGDPMIRVCASANCTNATRIPGSGSASGTTGPEDDACGRCPLARFVCPSSGQFVVYKRPFTYNASYTCTVGRT